MSKGSVITKLSNVFKFRKKKGSGSNQNRRNGNPLRFKHKEQDLDSYGLSASSTISPGSAEDILGIMINPRPFYIDTEDGEKKEVASFVSSDNNIAAIRAEIDGLTKQAAEISFDGLEDDEEKFKKKQALNEIRKRIQNRMDKLDSSIRAITYHDRPPAFPLVKVVEYSERATFLLRSFRRDFDQFRKRLEEIRHWGNKAYADYLDDYAYYVTGASDPSIDLGGSTLRDLVYWGEASQMLPEPRDVSGSLYGKVVLKEEAARFLYETNERYPYTIINRRPLKFGTYRGNVVKFACPKVPYFDDDYYIINQRGYRIYKWPLQTDADVMQRLLALDVDFLLCTEVSESRHELYASVLLRSSSELVSGNKLPKLDAISRQLRRLNATPLSGADLRHAFQAFVPGSDILHRSVRLKLHSKITPAPAGEFFEVLKQSINAGESTSKGNFFFGFKNGDKNKQILRDVESECVSMAFFGQQQAGKTETATKLFALPRTPNILFVHWSTAHGESSPRLAKKLGGEVLTIDLDDVSTREYPDRDKRLEAQEKVNEKAAERARKTIKKLSDFWISSGKPVGLPLVIKPAKDTVAYVNYALTFLEEFSLAYEKCFIPDHADSDNHDYQESDELHIAQKLDDVSDNTEDWIALAVDDPRLCVVFLDDISNLDEEGLDPELGHLKRDSQKAAREVIKTGLYNYRKRRQALIVTAHSFEHLKKFYPVDAFATLVAIGLSSREGPKVGTLYDPQKATSLGDMKVREDGVDLRLPPYILNFSVPLHDQFS